MRTSARERKPMSYREGSEKSGKMRDADVEIEIKTKGKKKGPESEMEDPDEEGPEEEEMDSSAGRRPRGSRKRSAKGAKNTKAPMDAEGSCSCGKKGKACSCGKAMKDAGCGMKKRSDALTAPEYLAACELGIQNRSRTYIRARLDAVDARNDLKCGKGAISPGKKCHKGTAQRVEPERTALVRRAETKLQNTAGNKAALTPRELDAVSAYYRAQQRHPGRRIARAIKTAAAVTLAAGSVAGLVGSVARAARPDRHATLERIYRAPSAKRDAIWAEGFEL